MGVGDGWMDGRSDEQMNRSVSGWMYGWVDAWLGLWGGIDGLKCNTGTEQKNTNKIEQKEKIRKETSRLANVVMSTLYLPIHST